MRTKRGIAIVFAAGLFTALNQPIFLSAQGSLTPPGAPAPTMKSLAQVEPRVDVQTLPGDSTNQFTISQPGSYYLSTNIAGVSGRNGVGIGAGDVTLDLNGFALIGVAGSSNGIAVIGARTNITIHNGTLRGWGGCGVDISSAGNYQLERLMAAANGRHGIAAGSGGTVSGCNARGNSGTGIDVLNGSVVTGCTAISNAFFGIDTVANCVVSDCVAMGNGFSGIIAPGNCTISGCNSSANLSHGIQVNFGCQVINNTCDANGGGTADGISVTSSRNRIEANHVSGNLRGIFSFSPNLVIRNSASANATNYAVSGGLFGPTNNFAGVGGGVITNNNPWVNFSY